MGTLGLGPWAPGIESTANIFACVGDYRAPSSRNAGETGEGTKQPDSLGKGYRPYSVGCQPQVSALLALTHLLSWGLSLASTQWVLC